MSQADGVRCSIEHTLLIPGVAQALCPGKGDGVLRQDKRRKSSGVRCGAFIIRHLWTASAMARYFATVPAATKTPHCGQRDTVMVPFSGWTLCTNGTGSFVNIFTSISKAGKHLRKLCRLEPRTEYGLRGEMAVHFCTGEGAAPQIWKRQRVCNFRQNCHWGRPIMIFFFRAVQDTQNKLKGEER